MIPTCEIITGDAIEFMREWEFRFPVQCCVTSPPYYGLRDYGHPGQLGAEATPEEYIARIVELGRGVRKVLADDGVFWLNLGDSYYNYRPGAGGLAKQSIAKTDQDLPKTTSR